MVNICVICNDSEVLGLSECSEKSFEKIKEYSKSWNQLGRLVPHKSLFFDYKAIT